MNIFKIDKTQEKITKTLTKFKVKSENIKFKSNSKY